MTNARSPVRTWTLPAPPGAGAEYAAEAIARDLLAQYPDDAAVIAASLATDRQAAGDAAGHRHWQRIGAFIEALRRGRDAGRDVGRPYGRHLPHPLQGHGPGT